MDPYWVHLLIDTNVLIAVEPIRVEEVEAGLDPGVQLLALCGAGDHRILVHPLHVADLGRDLDEERRRLRLQLASKYPRLAQPPAPTVAMVAVVGEAEPGSHDEVDHALLAAVVADAVDFLVTEDNGIHRKARRLGLADRVLRVADAVETLRALYVVLPQPPPAVERVKVHSLSTADPIFDSLREDYPGFDEWLARAKRDQRDAYVIGSQQPPYAAICLVNPEPVNEYGFPGRTLKISTFKVSPTHSGFRYGELLLKAVFEHAAVEAYDGIYVTVFDRHQELVSLFQDFGFTLYGSRSTLGETVLHKRLTWSEDDREAVDELNFNVRFGPPALKIGQAGVFVVPVQPRWHAALFPEVEEQFALVTGTHAYGNAIRKAYLCNSPSRRVTAGSTLLFYRSHDSREVSVVGVCESTTVSQSAEEISQLVGKRTVYSYAEIQKLATRPTLAILLRQACVLRPGPIGIDEMIAASVLRTAPQSIVGVTSREGVEWLRQRLSA